MKRKQRLITALVTSAALLAITGCGNNQSSSSPNESTEVQEESSSADETKVSVQEETSSEEPDYRTTPLEDMVVASSVYGWVIEEPTRTEDGQVTLTIMPAGKTEAETYTSAMSYGTSNAMTGGSAADLVVERCNINSFVEICQNASGEVIDMHRVLQSGLNFDTAKFGGDLTAIGSTVEHRTGTYTDTFHEDATGTTGMFTGLSGQMVSYGWLLTKDMDAGQITVGDGNLATEVFHETYSLADDVKVYSIDNYIEEINPEGNFAATEISLNELTASTLDEDGQLYKTPSSERHQVVVVFDKNYEKYDSAKVTEIYAYSSQENVDQFVGLIPQTVRITSDLSEPTQGEPKPYTAPYLISANPIAVVENKMWTIGDNEDNCPVFKGASDKEMGKEGDGDWLVLFDTGWPRDGYQYMRNIEKVGLDPRDLDMLLVPHGHGDHYGSLYDFWEMIVRSGRPSPIVYESYEDTIGFDIHGFPEISGIYTDAPVRSIITDWYPNDEWLNLGDGLQMMVTLTPGHSQGTGSVVFQVTVGKGGMKDARMNYEYDEEAKAYLTTYSDYEEGDNLYFIYMGGYGINGLASIEKGGFRRASFVASLRYLESVVSDIASDGKGAIYNLAQHTNQFPYTETAQVMEMYNADHGTNYPFLHFMREGRDEIINFLEKRASAMLYESYTAKYAEDYHQNGDQSPFYEYDGISVKTDITSPDIFGNTLEEVGPFKHEGGEVTIQIAEDVNVLVMHGYDVYLNKGIVPEGEYMSLSGDSGIAKENFDLSKGFAFAKDGFVYDPDVWYVQIGAHVLDDYDGNVYSGTGVNAESSFTSGPVESFRGDGWFEIIRTEGMTKEEAEALAASLEKGAYYTVNIKKTGDILNSENVMDTFVKTEKP